MKRIVVLLAVIIIFGPCAFSEVRHEEIFEQANLVIAADRGFERIVYDGLPFNDEVGAPQLPVKHVNMIIPFDMEIERIELDLDSVILAGRHQPIPVQRPRPTSLPEPPFVEPDRKYYGTADLYPKDAVSVVDYGFLAGFAKIVRLRVNPVQYHTGTRELQLNRRVAFALKLKKSTTSSYAVAVRSRKSQEVYRRLLESIVVNTNDVKRCARTVPSVAKSRSVNVIDYLVVAPAVLLEGTDPSRFQRFIDWKQEKGWRVRAVSYEQIWDAGYFQDDLHPLPIVSPAGGLRKFLYDQHTLNGVSFVLLVGDETNSPVMYKGYQQIAPENIPSDLYFADFDGDWNVNGDEYYGDDPDYVKDIFVGRLPVPSNVKSEVNIWIDKLLMYETNPGGGDPGYVMNAFFESADGILESQTITPPLDEYLTSFGFDVTVIYEWQSPDGSRFGPTGTQVIEWMRDANGIAALDCHGGKERVHVATTGFNSPPVYAVFSDSDYWIPGDWPIDEGGTNDLLHDFVNDRYHFYHSTSCDNGGYDINFDWTGTYDPVAESWISYARMFTNGDGGIEGGTGGPAIIANTRNGWYGASPNLRMLFFQVLLEGGAPYPHSTHKVGVSEAGSKALDQSDYLAHSSTLFGDPEMDLWTEVPIKLHIRVNLKERWAFVFELDETGHAIPVADALVAFSNGDDYSYARTNGSGVAYCPTVIPGLTRVTATKTNCIPARFFLSSAPLEPSGSAD